jgi:hypothetical protein
LRQLVIALLFVPMVACEYGFTLPSDTPKPEGTPEPGPFPLRERKVLLPGTIKGPPPPDAAVTSGECSEIEDGGPVHGPDCITAEIKCNETVIGHTRGGTRNFDTKFYEQKYCWPATIQKDGGDERVYRLKIPEQTRAYVTLDTPCADLDVMAMKWSGDVCPTATHRVAQCEQLRKDGTSREQLIFEGINATEWLVVVEGVGDAEGPFALHVQCIVRP